MSTDTRVIEVVDAAFAAVERPEHFTNYLHCEECAEHDRVLLQHDRETLRIDHVADPGWDPIGFCSPQGKAYYMPCLVRFALLEADDSSSFYWRQLLSHLEGDGPDNAFVSFCSRPQCLAIAMFLEYLVETRLSSIEAFDSTDQILRTHSVWTSAA